MSYVLKGATMNTITVSEEEFNELHKRIGIAMSRFPNLRYGQAVFNEAHGMWKEDVNKIRGTDDDCFYDDKKVPKFLSHFHIK